MLGMHGANCTKRRGWLVLQMTEGEQICPTCGASPAFAVPVWEDPDDAQRDKKPDYIGCTECHTMRDVGAESDLADAQ